MKTRVLLSMVAALAIMAAAGAAQAGRAPHGSLSAFASDAELRGYLLQLTEKRRRQLEENRRRAQAAAQCRNDAHISRSRPGTRALGRAAVLGGRVRNELGSPLSNALVLLEPFDTSLVAGEDGRYSLSVPKDGLTQRVRVIVTVRFIGYVPHQQSLTVSPGDSVEVELTVCPATGVEMSAATASEGTAAYRSITNTQHEGVDEGGIVKRHGDYLIILRRGRLFTVDLGGGALRPTAAVDAFGPGLDPRHAWYDELLVWHDRVVVIGYSYERGGTELGVFRMDRNGALRHLATYQLRSNDYYSSRNYASRLIGSTLVFYSPLYLALDDDPLMSLPALRRWNPKGGGRFERIVTPQRVYVAGAYDPFEGAALHAVTRCDLAARELTCQSTVVIGPWGRVFYVSPSAVYVWMSPWGTRAVGERRRAVLCRMPLDGSPPNALRVTGGPVDQFSFLESDDGYLNVLVRSEAPGDAMWGPEFARGATFLLRVAVADFGDSSRVTTPEQYRPLPASANQSWYYAYHNRFVGDHLLYGTGSGWWSSGGDTSTLYIVPWRGGAVSQLVLPHGVDRIETMGADAVVIGASDSTLHFTGIRLSTSPRIQQRYALPSASQGETRSHGFFYRGDGAGHGVLGLPVRSPGNPGYRHLFDESASVVFLRNDGATFSALGELTARASGVVADACKASCVDWYGNSRPLFLEDRVIALLGYELVEGRLEAGSLREAARVDFTPRQSRTVGR